MLYSSRSMGRPPVLFPVLVSGCCGRSGGGASAATGGLWITRRLGQSAPLQIPDTGDWRSEEVRVLIIFSLTALAWITLREPNGGWSGWFNLPTANYAAVALTAVVLMFVLPNGQGGKLLDWKSASSIHWEYCCYLPAVSLSLKPLRSPVSARLLAVLSPEPGCRLSGWLRW